MKTGRTANALRFAKKTISYTLTAGFAVQILLGLAWMAGNFTNLQLFGDTAFYVKVSGTLRCDEYTGVLYPAVLLIVRAVFARGPLAWYSVMYLIQLAAVFLAGAFFFRETGFCGGNRFWCAFGGLAILTFPSVMQCALAILPNGLTLAFLLPELAFLYRSVKEAQERKKSAGAPVPGRWLATECAKICLFWLCLALTMPEYLWIGAVIPAAFLLSQWMIFPRRSGKRMAYALGITGIFLGLIFGMNRLTQEKGLYGRPQQSFSTMLMNRTYWSAIMGYKREWPEELVQNVSWDALTQSWFYPEALMTRLEPELEERIGTRRAQELYREYARMIWLNYTGSVMWTTRMDFLGYLIPPAGIRQMLNGHGYDSFTLRNYDVMHRHTPRLTRCYVDYGMLWFEAACLLAAVAGALRILTGGVERAAARRGGGRDAGGRSRQAGILGGGSVPAAIAGMLTVLLAACWYTLQGSGVWDYKLVLGSTGIWLIGLLYLGVGETG